VATHGTRLDLFDSDPGEFAAVPGALGRSPCDTGVHQWRIMKPGMLYCLECGEAKKLPRRAATQLANRAKPGER
jgi:hypothetical protein